MVVGEQHPALWHHIFGVMGPHALLVGDDARQQVPVTGRSRVGVDDRQEVIALLRLVTGEYEQLMSGRRSRWRGPGVQAEQDQAKTVQHHSPLWA
jgi:hypothetical protein